jgi:hypothetical protein
MSQRVPLDFEAARFLYCGRSLPMYEFGIGHYLFYPLAIFLFSAIFFLSGYRVGRRRERSRALSPALGAEGGR